MSLMDSLLLDPFPLDVWVTPRTDGVLGSGTEEDPFNGSLGTSPNFDSVMRAVPFPVISITYSGGTATVFALYHGYSIGDYVLISGASDNAYNGVFQVLSVPNPYYFTYSPGGTPSGSSSVGNCRLEEAIMISRAVNPPVRVRLGPGQVDTGGYAEGTPGAWLVRSGMKMVGAGMGISTLRLVGGSVENLLYLAAAGPYNDYTDSFEASDLTVDCNIGGQVSSAAACGAFQIAGKHTRLRRIRAINFGSQGTLAAGRECFVIFAARAHPELEAAGLQCFDCVITDCIVEQPGLNDTVEASLIGFLADEGASMAYHRACAIRNCFADCEYRQNPVPISSISVASGAAFQVTTRLPHGHANGDFVRISGAVDGGGSTNNSFNGCYPIDFVDAFNFKYTPIPNQTTNPTGDMWVGRFSSHYVQVTAVSVTGTGPYTLILTTRSPHFLQAPFGSVPGSTVVIAGFDNAGYNGVFQVTGVPAYNQFQVSVASNPGAFTVYGVIGASFQALGGDGGKAAVIEGNRIINTRVAGPYHDTYSSREILSRNNYYRGVVIGPYQNLPGSPSAGYPVSSLTWASQLVTAVCASAHGFNPGDAVNISGATNPPYNGNFVITSVPDSTRLQYSLPTNPGVTGGTITCARIWQVDWQAVTNNHIELVPNPENFWGEGGMVFGYATYLSPPLFPQAMIRRNTIRNVDGASDTPSYPLPFAVYATGCTGLIIEENIVDLGQTNPIGFNSGTLLSCPSAEFFANHSSNGTLVQGYDLYHAAQVDELSTNVQDAALMAF